MWVQRPYTIFPVLGPLVSYTQRRRWRDHSEARQRDRFHVIRHCHGAAAVLSVFTVRLSPLFQYAISHCNSVYGETILSNLRGSSVGSLHLFLYSLRNAAFACVVLRICRQTWLELFWGFCDTYFWEVFPVRTDWLMFTAMFCDAVSL